MTQVGYLLRLTSGGERSVIVLRLTSGGERSVIVVYQDAKVPDIKEALVEYFLSSRRRYSE